MDGPPVREFRLSRVGDGRGLSCDLEAALEAELDSGFALRPGPYAEESVPASGAKVTRWQQTKVNEIGEESGCHTCGTDTPGTQDGHWIADHQRPTMLNLFGESQELYPHCVSCSARQGRA